MLVFCIDEVMEARMMKKRGRIQFLVDRDIRRNIAKKLVNGDATYISLRDEEIICAALVCTPSDLRKWVPDGHTILADGHPLKELKGQQNFNPMALMQKMTGQQIKDMFDAHQQKMKAQKDAEQNGTPPENNGQDKKDKEQTKKPGK